MAIYELDGAAPRMADSAWVADSAQVMGNVELAEDASVWFGVVIRGDVQMACLPAASVVALAKDGKVKMLAVSLAERSPFRQTRAN